MILYLGLREYMTMLNLHGYSAYLDVWHYINFSVCPNLRDRPVTGASMSPARTLGPAIVWHEYKGIWVYMTAPVAGAMAGAWIYNIIRYTDKPVWEITKSATFLRASSQCNFSKWIRLFWLIMYTSSIYIDLFMK